MKLNPAQAEAVRCTSGPCLVLAGAGSGKTRVITSKIVNLIRNHMLPPNTVCALTFTNKAAGEMRERVAAELGSETAGKVWISTFHSLGLELIRIEHRTLGLPRSFTLFDENDVFRVVRELVRTEYPELIAGSSEKEVLNKAINLIAMWKMRLIAPEDIQIDSPFSLLYKSYCDYLKACHTVDFEDLIFLSTRLLRDNEELRRKWGSCFHYVLVDEYQDTNETQYQLLKMLVGRQRRFTVVGDDDQSIYSWRGARPENLKTLSEDFPDLKVIKLEQNYRSAGRILDCANKLIANNPHLYEKTLFSALPPGEFIKVYECENDSREAELVVALIKAFAYRLSLKWKDFAVLYRSNFQSRILEKTFHESRIPCLVSGGSSFYDLQEVKDIMAYCRLISNLKDNAAFLRIINVPRRGIGESTLEAITSLAAELNVSNFEACLNDRLKERLQPAQHQAVRNFVAVMTKLRMLLLKKQDVYLAQNLPDLIGYEGYIAGVSSDPRKGPSKAAIEYKMRNVRMFMQWVLELIKGRSGEASLSFAQAVDELGLKEIRQRQSSDEEEDAVQLMTLHSSKGLEFPYVFLVGMEENILPHKNSLEAAGSQQSGVEEERRLAYVGITRAQQSLIITWCKERMNRDSRLYQRRSRFIDELPADEIQFLSSAKTIGPSADNDKQKLTDISQACLELNSLCSKIKR